MVNYQMISEIVDSFKLDQRVAPIPNAVPVCDVTPKTMRDALVLNVTSTTTGTQTILANTVYPNSKVRIKTISLNIIKDASCDVATGALSVQATIGGVVKTLLSQPVITLTAQAHNNFVEFPNPILIDNATAITLSGTFTAGVLVRTCTITYVLDDVL